MKKQCLRISSGEICAERIITLFYVLFKPEGFKVDIIAIFTAQLHVWWDKEMTVHQLNLGMAYIIMSKNVTAYVHEPARSDLETKNYKKNNF